MALRRMSQLGMIVETVEGTAETLVVGSLLPVLAGASAEHEIAQIERDIMRNTLTMADAIPGLKSGKVSFSMELAGPASGFASSLSNLDLPLRACGMRGFALKRVPIEATWDSGTIVSDGATFTGSGGATGKAWAITTPGDTHIFLLVSSGTVGASEKITFTNPDATTAVIDATGANATAYGYRPADVPLMRVVASAVSGGPITSGEVLLGGTSGAVGIIRADTSGSGSQGILYEVTPGSALFSASETVTVPGTAKTLTISGTPNQTQHTNPTVTIGVNYGSVVRCAIRGARGTWSLDLSNGERGLMRFDFQGAAIQPVDVVNFGYAQIAQAVPANVIGGLFSFDRTFLPAFSALSVALNNELALRDLPGDSTGAGYSSCAITGRAPSGSIDPEAFKRAVYDAHGKAWDKTAFRLAARVVSATAGNSFEVRAGKTQFGNLVQGERRGVLTTSMPMTFHGDPAQGTDQTYGGDELLLLQY